MFIWKTTIQAIKHNIKDQNVSFVVKLREISNQFLVSNRVKTHNIRNNFFK